MYLISVTAIATFREIAAALDIEQENPELWVLINKSTYALESIKIIDKSKFPPNDSTYYRIKIGNLQDFRDERDFSFLNHYLKFKYHSPVSEEVLNRKFYFHHQFLINSYGNPISLISIGGESVQCLR